MTTYIIHYKNGDLVTIDETRDLLDDNEMTEEKLEEIRDGFRYLVEVIVDGYLHSKSELNDTIELKEINTK